MEAAMAEIETSLRPLGVDMDLKFFPGYPPMRMNPDHHWIGEVQRAIDQITGSVPRLSGAQGSLDQAYATDKTGIPTCVYGVGRQMESNIHAGNQPIPADLSHLKYGVAVTDGCIDWATTETMLREARGKLKDVLPRRVPRAAEVRNLRG